MNAKRTLSLLYKNKDATRLAILLAVLFAVVLFSQQGFFSEGKPFPSSELRFSDTSPGGLSIVPASCPSDPHYPGECTGQLPSPPSSGCVIYANPPSITSGDSTLSWATYDGANTSGRTITPNVWTEGDVPAQGRVPVTPSQTTTYTYSGTYTPKQGERVVGSGPYSCSVTVTVAPADTSPQPPGGCSGEACIGIDPPELTFWASPALVKSGDSTTVYWTVENVSTCAVSGNGNSWASTGDGTFSSTTNPILSHTVYALTCTGLDGSHPTRTTDIDIIFVFCEPGIPGCTQSSAAVLAQLAAAGTLGNDLSGVIRAAILSDPRTAEMSEAEIDAMVTTLVAEAQAQGVTASDILWRPQEEAAGTGAQAGSCGALCKLTNAFGFDGSDVTIPFSLGVVAALLLFVIGMLLHRLGHHPVVGVLKSPGV